MIILKLSFPTLKLNSVLTVPKSTQNKENNKVKENEKLVLP